MPLLNRDAILAADDRRFEDVEVPEWGGTVRVGTVSAISIERMQNKLQSSTGTLRAAFVAASCVDENGAPMFSAEDVEVLAAKSNAVVNRLYEIASRLNSLDIEAAAKN